MLVRSSLKPSWSKSALRRDFHAPVSGEYAVRVHAYAQQNSNSPIKLTFMLGDAPVKEVEVETNAAAARVYQATLKLAPGRNRVRAVVRRVKDGLPEAKALQ